jgi:radical SAM/Cys-rich protein
MNEFDAKVTNGGDEGLYATGIDTIQVNTGLKCNQSCAHCHVGASPQSNEVMDRDTMNRILDLVDETSPAAVDITGGAPELNPDLRYFISELLSHGAQVQVRTNLTALLEPEADGLARYFRDNRVALVGSMPCYLEENVDSQRGAGVYEKSVEAIRLLNGLGYGREPELQLNLVYNPGGAFLPGSQAALEEAYKKELLERFGITFTSLLTITNMPIGRFASTLKAAGELDRYVTLLRESFNPGTLPGLMCRRQISIAWDGTMYDCDFNLALGLVMNHGAPDHISAFEKEPVASRRIVTGSHCFGCTAGAGSSCAGALAD